MSVRVSEREESNLEFLKVLMDIEKWTLYKSELAPKKFRFMINNQLVKHSADAYSYAKMANSVYVRDYETKQIREAYLIKAHSSLQAFVAQLDVIYSICKSDFMTNKEHARIAKESFEGLKLLKGLIKADKERYKGITPLI